MNKLRRKTTLRRICKRFFGNALAFVSIFSLFALCEFALALDKYVTPTGAGDGSDWANAYSNIQDAVDACTDAGDAIYLRYGAFTNSSQIAVSDRPGLSILGGYAGDTPCRAAEPMRPASLRATSA